MLLQRQRSVETLYLQNSLWHRNFYDYLQTFLGHTVQKVTEVTITQSTNYGVLPAFKKISWCHLWVVPISLACAFLITFSSDCFVSFFLCTHRISSYKIWDDHRPKSFKSKCIESWETTGRAKLWFTVAWFSEMGWWSPSSIRYFTKLPDLLRSSWALGTRIQRTLVQPWQAVDCRDVIEYNDTPGASTYFWQVIKGREKSENRPKENPKVINVSIACMCLNEKKTETLRLHAIGE